MPNLKKMVKSVVDAKPVDFNQEFNNTFKEKIQADKEAIKGDLKAHMFKKGDHSVDFDVVTGRKEPVKDPEPTDNADKKDFDAIDSFMNGLNKSIEKMHDEDKHRVLDPDADGGTCDDDQS